MNEMSPNAYEGTIKLKIGPVNGQFAGLYTISEENAPEIFTMTVKVKGQLVLLKVWGKSISPNWKMARTLFKYSGELNIGGKLASVGQRLIDSVSKSMLKSGLEKLDKEVEKRK